MHQFGDGVQNLLVASAAAGGTMGHILHMMEGFVHVGKGIMLVQRVFYIKIAYLLAIADHIVFHNNLHQCLFS